MIQLGATSRKCEGVEVKMGGQCGKIERGEMWGARRDGRVKDRGSCSD